MPFVLDNSVVCGWLLNNQATEYTAAIARQLQLPIRYIGVGEQVDDLRSFDARTFVDALFDESPDK